LWFGSLVAQGLGKAATLWYSGFVVRRLTCFLVGHLVTLLSYRFTLWVAILLMIVVQQWQWFSNVQWFSIGSGSARAVVRQWAVVQQWAPHCCCCGASATGSGLSDGQWFSNGLQQWQGLEQWTVVQQWQWFSNGLMQWQGSGALMLWQPSGTHFGPAPCFSNGNGKMSYCSDAVLMPALHHATALDGCSGSF